MGGKEIMVDWSLRKGDKVYFDEVGTGRVPAIFIRFEGMDAVVRPLRKKRHKKINNTLVHRRK